ncbi:hypothetical protein CEP51_009702 [Fusarium floridanum]|uniref:Uncharacterized protein n=1 Tax=Fusarium floridanum TaxID=1325733 RepID=A0A428RGR8_9HYPO|nr:hypothetical protein CEP51_009702 [Fusarium floridanum]
MLYICPSRFNKCLWCNFLAGSIPGGIGLGRLAVGTVDDVGMKTLRDGDNLFALWLVGAVSLAQADEACTCFDRLTNGVWPEPRINLSNTSSSVARFSIIASKAQALWSSSAKASPAG